jgi:spore coat polysaccharide biosynthesis protein SpsF
MKTGIVLQARMGSRRLPGKMLRPIVGRPLIGHVIERLKRAQRAQCLVLAIPDTAQDAPLKAIADECGIECFVGSEEDVLDRYYRAAGRFRLDQIVRATGDNPLVDPQQLDQLVDFHLRGRFEYSENFTVLPPGVGVEVFSREGLVRCWCLSDQPHQREGVNDYILEHPGIFRKGTLVDYPYPGVPITTDCTVDTLDQFGHMAALYEHLYREGEIVSTSRGMEWLVGRQKARA